MISPPRLNTSRLEDEGEGPQQQAANMQKEAATFNPTDDEFRNKEFKNEIAKLRNAIHRDD